MTIRCGIDLGGSKIEIICLNTEQQILYAQRINTPKNAYQATIEAIRTLVLNAEDKLNTSLPVGIGTPGAISLVTGLMKNCNSTCLNNQPLKQDLETLLDRPIKMTNDANCFALSEAIDGVAKNIEVVFGVIIGTGTGAGIVVNQQILNGANRIAGEWGHNQLPWSDSQRLQDKNCYCGLTGCIETFLSGPGLQDEYQRLTSKILSCEQIVKHAENGDPQCEAILQDYEENMAKALAHVINILDPDCIVLGGGMSNIKRLYQNVPRLWGKYVFSDSVATPLLAPEFGDASGVRGAARLWQLEEL